MKKNTIFLCLLWGITLVCMSQNTNKPFVVPEIKEWRAATGDYVLPKKVTIYVETNQKAELTEVAKRFAHDLSEMFQSKVALTFGQKDKCDIVLQLADIDLENKEAHIIDIGAKQIEITAHHSCGVHWATRTILQLFEQSENHSAPCGTILDYPSYPMRGFMLDVGRKFFTIDYLKAVVKMMSYYKMNTFQIHLNDNGFAEYFENDWDKTPSGFRLESTTYPGLASKDGHYTKEEFRRLQLEALQQGVTIIPEIDAPAHTLAFYHYDNELGSDKYGKDHLDLFNPKTYAFMDGLFKEYLEGENPVFIGDIVHIGTDEYSNQDKEVVEKFRYFTDRYIRYVESFGKKAALWGALTHAQGETPVKVDNVLLACWYNGFANPTEMMKMGYDLYSIPGSRVYIVPATGYYHDYLNITNLYNNWTPAVIGNQTFDEGHRQIKGGMFAVWNDHCKNGISMHDVHHRVVPAMQTLSAKMWSGKDVTIPFELFDEKRKLLSEAPGLNLLARPKNKGVVFEAKNPHRAYKPTYIEIGYDYRVEFDLMVQENELGTLLFESPHSKFYLCEPSEGKLGFWRDGYSYQFDYQVPPRKWVHIAIEGTNKSTSLYVNGQLIESLDVVQKRVSLKNPNTAMNWVQTLVFPLEKLAKFKGKMRNLKVTAL